MGSDCTSQTPSSALGIVSFTRSSWRKAATCSRLMSTRRKEASRSTGHSSWISGPSPTARPSPTKWDIQVGTALPTFGFEGNCGFVDKHGDGCSGICNLDCVYRRISAANLFVFGLNSLLCFLLVLIWFYFMDFYCKLLLNIVWNGVW